MRDVESAGRKIKENGEQAEIQQDGSIELNSVQALAHPDEINRMLVEAGNSPTQLIVEEEELEQYFLRLIGMKGGMRNG